MPAAGSAVSVSSVPSVIVAAQTAPQLIPPLSLVTDPEPLPFLVTVTLDAVAADRGRGAETSREMVSIVARANLAVVMNSL